MTDLTMVVQGLPELQRRLSDAPEKLHAANLTAMRKSVLHLAGEAKQRTPVDTGRLRSSINNRVEGIGSEMIGRVGSPLSIVNNPAGGYLEPVEFGRRAGAKPPPSSALATWASRHGIASAYVLARAIGRRGIPGRFMFTNAFKDNIDRVKRWFYEEFKRAVEAI